jgi:hypothetical protein
MVRAVPCENNLATAAVLQAALTNMPALDITRPDAATHLSKKAIRLGNLEPYMVPAVGNRDGRSGRHPRSRWCIRADQH